jgi:adenylate kinase family enzyme
VIRRRVAEYVENTAPLVEWYRKGPTFRAIDGNRPLMDVAGAFDAAVLECLR